MRMTKEKWLEKSLDLLVQHGQKATRIEPLCHYLGVTKGSFYHHFKNREDYIYSLLQFWAKHNTFIIIEGAKSQENLEDTRRFLADVTANIRTDIEKTIRSWAQREKIVADYVQKIDQLRIEYLVELIGDSPAFGHSAPLMAKFIYAHFIGCQQLDALITKEEHMAMDQWLLEIFF